MPRSASVLRTRGSLRICANARPFGPPRDPPHAPQSWSDAFESKSRLLRSKHLTDSLADPGGQTRKESASNERHRGQHASRREQGRRQKSAATNVHVIAGRANRSPEVSLPDILFAHVFND